MSWKKRIDFHQFSRWWFQTLFIFTPIWGRFPIWLICFRWVETTSQSSCAMLVSIEFRVHRSFYRGDLSSKGAGTTTKLSNSGFFVGRWYCCDGILVQDIRCLGWGQGEGWVRRSESWTCEVVENRCIFLYHVVLNLFAKWTRPSHKELQHSHVYIVYTFYV